MTFFPSLINLCAQQMVMFKFILRREKPGSHWLLHIVQGERGRRNVQFFDSFGHSPAYYKIQTPPFRISAANHVQVQPDGSSLCGLYCLYVYYHRLRKRSFGSIMKDFSKFNKRRNDIRVLKFFKKLNYKFE